MLIKSSPSGGRRRSVRAVKGTGFGVSERSEDPCTGEADGSGARFSEEEQCERNFQAHCCAYKRSHQICENKWVCNRYRLTHSKQYLAERFEAWDEIEDRPRYNIAPTQPVVTVRREMGKKTRKFTTMRWGLIPSWAKDMTIGTRTLNARSETVTTTSAFRQSILTKRCLIPAGGFYEWQKMDQ